MNKSWASGIVRQLHAHRENALGTLCGETAGEKVSTGSALPKRCADVLFFIAQNV